MNNDQKVRRYLSELAREVEKVVSGLPDGVDGTVSVRGHYVYLIVRGPRLAAFTLVLGSESPEIVYDGQYIRYDAIPPGMDAQIDFAKETVDDIVEFVFSGRLPVERKSRILGRPYLSIPMSDGTGWKLKKFD